MNNNDALTILDALFDESVDEQIFAEANIFNGKNKNKNKGNNPNDDKDTSADTASTPVASGKTPNATKILKIRMKLFASTINSVDKALKVFTNAAAKDSDAGTRSLFKSGAKTLSSLKQRLISARSKWANVVQSSGVIGDDALAESFINEQLSLEDAIFGFMEAKDSKDDAEGSALDAAIASLEEAKEGADSDTKKKIDKIIDKIKDLIDDSENSDEDKEDSDDDDDDDKKSKDDKDDDSDDKEDEEQPAEESYYDEYDLDTIDDLSNYFD